MTRTILAAALALTVLASTTAAAGPQPKKPAAVKAPPAVKHAPAKPAPAAKPATPPKAPAVVVKPAPVVVKPVVVKPVVVKPVMVMHRNLRVVNAAPVLRINAGGLYSGWFGPHIKITVPMPAFGGWVMIRL